MFVNQMSYRFFNGKERLYMNNKLIGKRLDEILCHEVTTMGKHLTTGMGEAHMLLAMGGIKINNERITDIDYIFSEKDYLCGISCIRVGQKKSFIITRFGEIL